MLTRIYQYEVRTQRTQIDTPLHTCTVSLALAREAVGAMRGALCKRQSMRCIRSVYRYTHAQRMVHAEAYEVHAQRIQIDTPLPRSKVWPEVRLGLTQAAAGKNPRTRLSGAPQRAC